MTSEREERFQGNYGGAVVAMAGGPWLLTNDWRPGGGRGDMTQR
jgi:hypothetical protein